MLSNLGSLLLERWSDRLVDNNNDNDDIDGDHDNERTNERTLLSKQKDELDSTAIPAPNDNHAMAEMTTTYYFL